LFLEEEATIARPILLLGQEGTEMTKMCLLIQGQDASVQTEAAMTKIHLRILALDENELNGAEMTKRCQHTLVPGENAPTGKAMYRRIHVQEENVVIGQTMTSRLILAVRIAVENAARAVIKMDPR
jgi:hypothetical protein